MMSDAIPRTLIASPDSISTERALKQILGLLLNIDHVDNEDKAEASIADVKIMLRAIQ